MRVHLSGYNIDSSLIELIPNHNQATPEVISAAYARISRSTKSIHELRREAITEIEKARQSNQNIIYEMGHSSIAEHGVFNFDIIGISRYLAEFVQKSRLASYTEKSQRYVIFENDFVVPYEIDGTDLEKEYIETLNYIFQQYHQLITKLKFSLIQQTPHLKIRELETKAKEDARYILPLSTKTQMGMTINARSLEQLLRRLDSIDLYEAKDLYNNLYQKTKNVAPSLIKYVHLDSFDQNNVKINLSPSQDLVKEDVKLLAYTSNPDDVVLKALLFANSSYAYSDIELHVNSLSIEQKGHLWNEVFANMNPWNKVPRAFESVDFTFELNMSNCCFAQLKRHRLCTMIKQNTISFDEYIIPPIILENHLESLFLEGINKAEKLALLLNDINPKLMPYSITNAHKVCVLMKINLRELYHFVRLRSDIHAQWEIKNISDKMARIVKQIAPYSTLQLMGKSAMIG